MTQEDNSVRFDNLLERESRAPQPVSVEESDDDPEGPTTPRPTEGSQEPSRLSAPDEEDPYVGYVRAEEDMEDHYIFYRPSQGKKVLVVDRKKNECFFLKWKTFNKDQRKGRELDPRYFDQLEKKVRCI